MALKERLVIGLHQGNGKITGNTEALDSIAETTLQRCALNERKLRALDVSNMRFTTTFLTRLGSTLSHNTTLLELYLDNCCIGDEGLRILAQGLGANVTHSLKAMSLIQNQVTCKGVAHLAKAMDAHSHRWSRTFGGYKAPSMGPGRGLQYLCLSDNEVAAAGARHLAEVLMRGDDSLEFLILERNKICDWGMGWLAMALRNHGVLQQVSLQGNPFGPDGLEELKNACVAAQASLLLKNQENGFTPLVTGTNDTTVLVSIFQAAAPPPDDASEPNESGRSTPLITDGFRRPGSASRRTAICEGRRSRPSSAGGNGSRPTSAAGTRGSQRQFQEGGSNTADIFLDETFADIEEEWAARTLRPSSPSSGRHSRPQSADLYGGKRGRDDAKKAKATSESHLEDAADVFEARYDAASRTWEIEKKADATPKELRKDLILDADPQAEADDGEDGDGGIARPSSASRLSRPSSAAKVSRPSSASIQQRPRSPTKLELEAKMTRSPSPQEVEICQRTGHLCSPSRSPGRRLRISRRQGAGGRLNPAWPPHAAKLMKVSSIKSPSRKDQPTFLRKGASDALAGTMRMRSTERGVAGDETEIHTILASPSRWRWRPGNIPSFRGTSGAGATAARGLGRPSSAGVWKGQHGVMAEK